MHGFSCCKKMDEQMVFVLAQAFDLVVLVGVVFVVVYMVVAAIELVVVAQMVVAVEMVVVAKMVIVMEMLVAVGRVVVDMLVVGVAGGGAGSCCAHDCGIPRWEVLVGAQG